MNKIVILLFLISVSFSQIRTVGYSYMTDPVNNNVDLSKVTHMISSFIFSDSVGDLTFQSWVPEQDMIDMIDSARSAGSIPMIALGTTVDGWKMTQSETARANFIQNLLNWCEINDVSGIDLDLEGVAEEFNWGNPATFFPESYEKLAVELRAAMPASMLLTAAVGSSSRNGAQWTDRFLDQLDFINVMIYDRALTWASSPVENHSTLDAHLQSAEYWHYTRGLAKSKMSLGIPFYARGWDRTNGKIYSENAGWGTTATFDYKHLVEKYEVTVDSDTVHFEKSDTILYKRTDGIDGECTIFFNGKNMVATKTQLTIDNGYGGVMIWPINGDVPVNHELSLLAAIDSVKSEGASIDVAICCGKSGGEHSLIGDGISLGNHTIVSAELFTLNGRRVQFVENIYASHFDFSKLSLSAGNYLIRLQDISGSLHSSKIMIQ